MVCSGRQSFSTSRSFGRVPMWGGGGGTAIAMQVWLSLMFRKKQTADPLSGGGGLKVEKINAEKQSTICGTNVAGWNSLKEGTFINVLFFKIDHGMAPRYLSNLLPPIVEDLSSYRLQNAGNYVDAKTVTYADSFHHQLYKRGITFSIQSDQLIL